MGSCGLIILDDLDSFYNIYRTKYLPSHLFRVDIPRIIAFHSRIIPKFPTGLLPARTHNTRKNACDALVDGVWSYVHTPRLGTQISLKKMFSGKNIENIDDWWNTISVATQPGLIAMAMRPSLACSSCRTLVRKFDAALEVPLGDTFCQQMYLFQKAEFDLLSSRGRAGVITSNGTNK